MKLSELRAGTAGNLHTPAKVGDIITDANPPGFGVLVGKNGRSFVVRFRLRGQPTQYTYRIGSLDGDKAISLAEARKTATRIKLDAEGDKVARIAPKHPDQDLWDRKAAEKAAAEAATAAKAAAVQAANETFKAVAERYLRDEGKRGGAGLAASTRLEYGRKLKKDLAEWHDKPIGEISSSAIEERIDLKGATAKVAANRLLAFVKVVFAYAKRKRLIAVDAALDVERPFDEHERERKLSDAEIAIFWEACGKLEEPMGRFYRLLLVTGQRRGEVAGMRRSELRDTITLKHRDLRAATETVLERLAWKLPGGVRTKNKKPHTVPLPDLAVELIQQAPVLKGYDDKPLDHVLATGAAGDKGPSGWSKFRGYLDTAIAEVMAEKAEELGLLPEAPFTEPWHVHDLRATVVSRMEQDLGVPEYITARVLNHSAGGGITRTYIRNKYDFEAAEALQAWADLIKRIVGLNVEPFPKRKRRGA